MKPITLHPLSVRAGLALAGVVALSTGAAQVRPMRTVFVGEVPAEWWTYFQVTTDGAGTPVQSYVVPLDRRLVVTGWKIGNGFAQVNGQVMGALDGVNSDGNQTFKGNGTRVVLPPGALIEGLGISSFSGFWGYLEPVQ